MTERTYGNGKHTLSALEQADLSPTARDMAAHIRELQAESAKHLRLAEGANALAEKLQAENAKLIESVDILDKEYGEKCEEYNNLEGELFKLKAERREFGMRVASAIMKQLGLREPNTIIAAIVEQELNK